MTLLTHAFEGSHVLQSAPSSAVLTWIRRAQATVAARLFAFVLGCLMLFASAVYLPAVAFETLTWSTLWPLLGSLILAGLGAVSFWVGASGIVARLIDTQ
ncbi:hypothetical protein [Gordonia aurantiaca]|uniref:hypothetical protein n=1 Tax=Gordonia sp. B21 TaxID=3151852 RepID=UPI00326391BC